MLNKLKPKISLEFLILVCSDPNSSCFSSSVLCKSCIYLSVYRHFPLKARGILSGAADMIPIFLHVNLGRMLWKQRMPLLTDHSLESQEPWDSVSPIFINHLIFCISIWMMFWPLLVVLWHIARSQRCLQSNAVTFLFCW